jgi:hypothetical protein
MEYVAVYAERLQGVANAASMGRIFLRPIANGSIGRSYEETEYGRMPLIWTGSIPHTMVSYPLRRRDEREMPVQAMKLKDYVIGSLEELREKSQKQLGNVTQGSKKRERLEQRIAIAETAIKHSQSSFKTEPGMESSAGMHYKLTLPPIKKSTMEAYLSRSFQISSIHNAPSASLQRYLRMPYSIIDIGSDGALTVTERKVTYEMIRDAGAMALDAETHNWKRVEAASRLRKASHREIALEYLMTKGNESGDIDEGSIVEAMKLPRRTMILGIEKILNDDKNEMITLITLNSENCNRLITVFEYMREDYFIEDPVTSELLLVPVTAVGDSKRIGSVAAGIISEFDPLFITGHNHVNFDYPVITKLSNKSFPIGADDSSPQFKHTVPGGFIKAYDVKGRDTIDPAMYFMLHEYTWSRKLDEVTKFLHQQSSLKAMSHEQLDISTHEAIAGNRDEAELILEYGWSDGQKSLHNFNALLEEVYAASLLYGARMIDVSTVSPKALSSGFWSGYFMDNGMLPHFDPTFHHVNANFFTEDSRYLFEGMENNEEILFSDFSAAGMQEQVIKRISDGFTAKGTHDAILIALHPYLNALTPLFGGIGAIRQAYDSLESIVDNHSKARMLSHIQNVMELPLFDAMSQTRTAFRRNDRDISRDSEAKFTERYGAQASLSDVIGAVHEEYLGLHTVLRGEKILGVRGRYILLPECSDIDIDKIKGIEVSRGKAFIAAPNKFVYHSERRIISSGISSPAQNTGIKSAFEKNTMMGFYSRMFDDNPYDAVLFLHDSIRDALEEKINENDNIYEKVAGKNYHDYSINAKGRMIEEHTRNRVMKGERSRVDIEGDDLKMKLKERFSPLATMALGQSDELALFKRRLLSGELTPIELEVIRAHFK